jgi:hypothetical protein
MAEAAYNYVVETEEYFLCVNYVQGRCFFEFSAPTSRMVLRLLGCCFTCIERKKVC